MFNIYYSFFCYSAFRLIDDDQARAHFENAVPYLPQFKSPFPQTSADSLSEILTSISTIEKYDESANRILSNLIKQNEGILIDEKQYSVHQVWKETKNLSKLIRNLYCNLYYDFDLKDEVRDGASGVDTLKKSEAYAGLRLGRSGNINSVILALGREDAGCDLRALNADTFVAVKALDELVEKINNGTAVLEDVLRFNSEITPEKFETIKHIIQTGLSDEVTAEVDARFDETYRP